MGAPVNYVFLSPHFPPNFMNFCKALKAEGVNVLGLADEPYEKLGPDLKGALTEYYRVPDLHDYDALLRAVGFLIHKHGRIDRIDSHNEYWLETEARLRTDFNIPGIGLDRIRDMKAKSAMKAVFRKAGVAVAEGEVVDSLEKALAFAARVGYPLVAKPDVGVGAADTHKVADRAGLEAIFAKRPGSAVFLERFIAGSMCSFDGLVDREGRLAFFTSHVYNCGVMEAVNDDRHVYYYSVRDVPADLEAAGRRILAAFQLKERFFHFEFFRTEPAGELVALEVNMRPPGGLTTDMFNYACDIDIYRQWATLVARNEVLDRFERKYFCAYVGRKAGKKYVHTHDAVLARFGSSIPHHEPIVSAFAVALGNYGYLVRAAEHDRLMEIIAMIHETA